MFSLEFFLSLEQIKYIFDNFEKWAKPESVEFSIYFGARPHIRKEPKGVVLIFVPFNYPIILLASPLVSSPAQPLAATVAKSRVRLERLPPGTLPASRSLNSFQQRARCSPNSSQSTWIRIYIVLSTVTFQFQRRFVYLHFLLHRTLTPAILQLLELPWDHSELPPLSTLDFINDPYQFSTQASTVVAEKRLKPTLYRFWKGRKNRRCGSCETLDPGHSRGRLSSRLQCETVLTPSSSAVNAPLSLIRGCPT